MAHSLFIIRDEEYNSPLYAEPPSDELDEDLWEALCVVIHEAFEGDGAKTGSKPVGEYWLGWRLSPRLNVSFAVLVPDDIPKRDVDTYLKELSSHYFNEVTDYRYPDEDGLVDVVIDVIPPWDE